MSIIYTSCQLHNKGMWGTIVMFSDNYQMAMSRN